MQRIRRWRQATLRIETTEVATAVASEAKKATVMAVRARLIMVVLLG